MKPHEERALYEGIRKTAENEVATQERHALYRYGRSAGAWLLDQSLVSPLHLFDMVSTMRWQYENQRMLETMPPELRAAVEQRHQQDLARMPVEAKEEAVRSGLYGANPIWEPALPYRAVPQWWGDEVEEARETLGLKGNPDIEAAIGVAVPGPGEFTKLAGLAKGGAGLMHAAVGMASTKPIWRQTVEEAVKSKSLVPDLPLVTAYKHEKTGEVINAPFNRPDWRHYNVLGERFGANPDVPGADPFAALEKVSPDELMAWGEGGFINTESGEYLTRTQAAEFAKERGQMHNDWVQAAFDQTGRYAGELDSAAVWEPLEQEYFKVVSSAEERGEAIPLRVLDQPQLAGLAERRRMRSELEKYGRGEEAWAIGDNPQSRKRAAEFGLGKQYEEALASRKARYRPDYARGTAMEHIDELVGDTLQEHVAAGTEWTPAERSHAVSRAFDRYTDALKRDFAEGKIDADDVRRAVGGSTGDEKHLDATETRYVAGQGEWLTALLERWEELPERVWHVTTNRRGVERSGRLRSRSTMDISRGAGLGASNPWSVSVSADPKVAKSNLETIREAVRFLNGDLTEKELVVRARKGDRGSRRFVDDPAFKDQLRYEARRRELGESTPETRWNVFRAFLDSRQLANGPTNPRFVGTDLERLSRMRPEDVALIELEPVRTGARGVSGSDDYNAEIVTYGSALRVTKIDDEPVSVLRNEKAEPPKEWRRSK